MRIGQIVKLRDRRFRIAIVVDTYGGELQVLVCKWMNNGATWTQPRLERTDAVDVIDREQLDARKRRVIDEAASDIRARAGVVRYRGGEHRLHGAEVST
jgi:hypothetical protein